MIGPTIPMRTIQKPKQNVKNAYLKAPESYPGRENLQDQGLSKPGEGRPENGAPLLLSSTVN